MEQNGESWEQTPIDAAQPRDFKKGQLARGGAAMAEISLQIGLLPPEILHRHLLPLLRAPSLVSLALTSTRHCQLVKTFLAEFNTSLSLSTRDSPVPCSNQDMATFQLHFKAGSVKRELSRMDYLHFLAVGTNNLRRIHLDFNEASSKLRKAPWDLQNLLFRILSKSSKLESVILDMPEISTEIIKLLAWDCPTLKSVKFSSLNLFWFNEQKCGRRIWPCSCWGTQCRLPEPKLDYNKTFLSKGRFDIEIVIERRVVRCLRKLRRDYIFEDLHTLQAPESEICSVEVSSDRPVKAISPLAYHDLKCRKGLFYDGNTDQEDYALLRMPNLLNQ